MNEKELGTMVRTPIQVAMKAREMKPELIQEAVYKADPMSWDGLEIKQAMVNFYSLLLDGITIIKAIDFISGVDADRFTEDLTRDDCLEIVSGFHNKRRLLWSHLDRDIDYSTLLNDVKVADQGDIPDRLITPEIAAYYIIKAVYEAGLRKLITKMGFDIEAEKANKILLVALKDSPRESAVDAISAGRNNLLRTLLNHEEDVCYYLLDTNRAKRVDYKSVGDAPVYEISGSLDDIGPLMEVRDKTVVPLLKEMADMGSDDKGREELQRKIDKRKSDLDSLVKAAFTPVHVPNVFGNDITIVMQSEIKLF